MSSSPTFTLEFCFYNKNDHFLHFILINGCFFHLLTKWLFINICILSINLSVFIISILALFLYWVYLYTIYGNLIFDILKLIYLLWHNLSALHSSTLHLSALHLSALHFDQLAGVSSTHRLARRCQLYIHQLYTSISSQVSALHLSALHLN